ncbi:MAG TPA: hypothetical protein VK430_07715 [Xanthobacteraceae bacterium]|nr:hypothetical protein [Xanthobacteraceae bacterium]
MGAMSKHHLGFLSLSSAKGQAVLASLRGLEAMQRGAADASADDGDLLFAGAEGDQLALDIAEIERASAALRKIEPALESWTKPPTSTIGKPRPVWLIIGVLWLSTALVTLGAVAAIARLVG